MSAFQQLRTIGRFMSGLWVCAFALDASLCWESIESPAYDARGFSLGRHAFCVAATIGSVAHLTPHGSSFKSPYLSQGYPVNKCSRLRLSTSQFLMSL